MLSFFSIFGIQNNHRRGEAMAWLVVNCFHFSVSLGYKTTGIYSITISAQLWIAFIFQYLWDTKQLDRRINQHVDSCELLSFFSIFGIQNNKYQNIQQYYYGCELLSFFSIFGIQNNRRQIGNRTHGVVNCFHFSVSLGYKTTDRIKLLVGAQLWIAFIFQYLWDTKQR